MSLLDHQFASGTTRIRRLRIRGSDLDALTVKQRTETELNQCQFGKTGLPAAAILCIRSFRDPSPGSLRLHGVGREKNAAWAQAAAAALVQIYQNAARPAAGPAPASAEAVLFLDATELLASLARDWINGTAQLHWWWKSLYPGEDIASVVPRAWRENVEDAPAALERLSATGSGAAFLHALASGAVQSLQTAMVEKFGLPAALAIAPALQDALDAEREPRPMPATSESAPARRPPWRKWISESEEGNLSGGSLLFLVTGLLLHRAPVIVRRTEFCEQARAWVVSGAAVPQQDRAALRPDANHELPPEAEPRPLAVPGPASLPSKISHEPDLRDPSAPINSREIAHEVPPRFVPPDRERVEAFSDAQQPGSPNQALASMAATQALSGPAPSPSPALPFHPPKDGSPFSIAETAFVELVKTNFGGIFYLINLAQFLGLYGDFTSPLRPGLSLPIWDFLALVGERLIGERLHKDPMWLLLAKLSGRDDTAQAGEGFAGPRDWPMPGDWTDYLHSFGEPKSGHQGMNPWVMPGQAAPGWESIKQAAGSFVPWLDRIMPYLVWRLCRALGTMDSERMTRLLCEQPAQISMTSSRIVVTFSLDELPIQVRLSGLDRNPGWVPAAGRYIEFRYD